MNVYRIQPPNADLHGIETETSEGNLAGGVHVFVNMGEARGCREWRQETPPVEFVTIECEKKDLANNGDYEGMTLKAGRGKIVSRKIFASIGHVADWLETQPSDE